MIVQRAPLTQLRSFELSPSWPKYNLFDLKTCHSCSMTKMTLVSMLLHVQVQVLSNLRHPHLVTLFGACLEAWSLVSEYLPNGSLQQCLLRKTSAPPLTWKTRIRIAAEISSALLFLHSSKPEKIIHGDLKPENILLDSEYKCKISDFGISRLLPEDTLRCPSFRRSTEPKGAFPYTDPEFQRTGDLTPKSDVYSFGIIVLQLLTGRSPVGLASDVRRAMSTGKLSSVCDPSAGEWPILVARRLAEIGIQCSETSSRDRPELMPAMVKELERLHVVEERPVPSFFLCPILQVSDQTDCFLLYEIQVNP